MAGESIGVGTILVVIAMSYVVYVLYKNANKSGSESLSQSRPNEYASSSSSPSSSSASGGGGGGPAPMGGDNWSALPPAGGSGGGVPAPMFEGSLGGTIQAQTIPGSNGAGAEFQPGDLLPKDTNSEWAQMNPVGKGDLANVDLLQPGVHFNIDTVGQSNKNKNLQERDEPPNPQLNVGIWNQSTLTPHFMRPVVYTQ